MPTYEYKCPKCGTEFELFQRITATAGAKCAKCGAKAERQLSGGTGLVFKGSGFYLTDYGRAGQKPRKAEGGESAPSEKPASPKPADKPAESKSKPSKKDD
jgi:putative FmdB family regulatory protein